MKYPNAICIAASGWVNAPVVRSRDGRLFIVAYSLHSNFREMEAFVRCIQPAKISPLERSQAKPNKLEELVEQGTFVLKKMKQKGLDRLNDSYTNLQSLSSEYRELQVKIVVALLLISTHLGSVQLGESHA